MKKKSLAILFIFATCVLSALAAEKVKIGDLYYSLNTANKTAKVISQNPFYPRWTSSITTANIPQTIRYQSKTYRVTCIEESAFHGCSSLISITIPNSVTSIRGMAFSYCRNLISITIPNSVTSIGHYAFEGCSALTTITIPKSIISIEEDAFHGCSSLISINVVKDNPNYTSIDGVLFNKNKSKLVRFPDGKQGAYSIPNSVKSIDYEAFKGCSNLTSITIPNSVTSIGEEAFRNCRNLISITIPNSVTSIGEEAFRNCRNLISITIPNSVTSIDDFAYAECSSLTSITIPHSVKNIGYCAFSYCNSLDNIDVVKDNPNYSSVDGVLFNKNKTILVQYPAGKKGAYVIPNSVTRVTGYAFHGCGSLTSVTIPYGVTEIWGAFFKECTSLTYVFIPNSVKSIDYEAFKGCSNLTSITIPNSVTSIGREAFSGCSSLISITIPNSVTSIGEEAFKGCTSLKEINYPEKLDMSKIGVSTITKLIAYNPYNSSTSTATTSSTRTSTANNTSAIASPSTTNQQTITSTQHTTPATPKPTNRPTCRIISPSDGDFYSTPKITLRYEIENAPKENYSVQFLVAGLPVLPMNQGRQKGAQFVKGTEVDLQMPQDKKTAVAVRLIDAQGTPLCEESITLKYVSVHKPTLHVFAVGVNKYKAEGFTKLNYAEKDADDFVKTIMQVADKTMYEKVDTALIIGNAATTFNLQERLTQLATRVQPNDVVMIFFSGHGLKENRKSYFISSDALKPYQGLDMEFVRNRADEMDCPVFVFMDACHSTPASDATKGYVEPITIAESGIIGFYSCKAGQQSIERSDLRNGVFTYVLVQGLKGEAAINGNITIFELEKYIKEHVPTLSERQTPVVLNSKVGNAILFHVKTK